MQNIHLAAGQQWRDHFKRGILGCSADQSDCAILDVGQKSILLGLIEAVNLIDEQNSSLVIEFSVFSGPGYDLLDLFDHGSNRREEYKIRIGGLGNNVCQSSLAASWRAP